MSELPPCRHEKLSLESVGYAIGHWVCECGWSSDANCLPEVNKQLAALRALNAEAMGLLSDCYNFDILDGRRRDHIAALLSRTTSAPAKPTDEAAAENPKGKWKCDICGKVVDEPFSDDGCRECGSQRFGGGA